MFKVSIVGTTIWGVTLAVILAEKGIDIGLWARTKKESDELQRIGPDPEETLGMDFPPNILITDDMEAALDEARAVILVVPSQSMRQNVISFKAFSWSNNTFSK